MLTEEAELNFHDDLFQKKIQQKEKQTRRQKREDWIQHAVVEREKSCREGQDWMLGLTQEELRRLQIRDKTLEDLEKGDDFHRKNGLLYQQWIPRTQTGGTVEQLVYPVRVGKRCWNWHIPSL